MGKWTPDYLDDVLQAKISSLVTGAIRRSAIEKEPTISYENFVNELDTGDSFTTTLIDILVKELAERRTRPVVTDRRLIAGRTAKSLRQLAAPLSIYAGRPRGYPSRRPINITDYSATQTDGLDADEDEDAFENMLDNITDGTRVTSSDLYDAIAVHPWQTRSIFASPSPLPDDASASARLPPPPLRSPTATSRTGPWTFPPAVESSSSSTLLRQPSIRRPMRSRTVDFNDYTRRHRSSIRDSLVARSEAAEGVTEPREESWTSRNATSQGTRRFFPFSRTRRHDPSSNLSWSEIADIGGEGSDDTLAFINVDSVSNPVWYQAPSPAATASPPHAPQYAETTEDRVVTAPRLRRGGLRAPESMLSRHVSPIPDLESSASEFPSFENIENEQPAAEPAAYPTPGSTENEHVS